MFKNTRRRVRALLGGLAGAQVSAETAAQLAMYAMGGTL